MNETRIQPIRNDNDYAEALKRIEALMDASAGTWQMDELEVLAQLVETYEDKRWPIDLPSPRAAIKFRMEQSGLTPRDLEPYIGGREEVSQVLSGSRPLTLEMVRALHKNLSISLEVLLRDPDSNTS